MRYYVEKILRPRVSVPAVAGAGIVSASLGVGFALGCYIQHRRWAPVAREALEELQHTTIQLNRMIEDERQLTLPNVDTLNDLLDQEESRFVIPEEALSRDPSPDDTPIQILEHKPDIRPPVTNVFRVNDDGWNQDFEESMRSEDGPYIISQEEFFADERSDQGYLQDSMTYYEGDDVLADMTDAPQYDHKLMVGELIFGHGSKQDDIVYVRNPKLKMEYEISRDPGSYEHEILNDGIMQDIPKDPPRKFREE